MKSSIAKLFATLLVAVMLVALPLTALAAPTPNATINITVDDEYELYVNGVKIGEDKGQNKWQTAENWRVYLDETTPVVVRGNDAYATIAGMTLTITYDDARPDAVASAGTGWLVRPGFNMDWVAPTYTPGSSWADVHNISPNNAGWNSNLGVRQWVWTPKYLYSSNPANFDELVTFWFMPSAPISYTLTYLAGAGGSVSGTTPQAVLHGADGTQVTAVPATGYTFVDWSDGVTTDSRIETNVTANLTVTAHFAPIAYTLTYLAGAGGSVSGTTPQTVLQGEDGTQVTAVPDTGYSFVGWSDAVGSASRTEINVTDNHTVTANFELIPPVTFTLNYSADTGGSISGTTPQTVVAGGNGMQVTAVPSAGYYFTHWSDEVLTPSRTETDVQDNLDVTAYFAPLLTVTFHTDGGTPQPPVQYLMAGETAIRPVPDPSKPGYHFVDWYYVMPNGGEIIAFGGEWPGYQAWDFADGVYQNLDLYAMYTPTEVPATFTVTYRPGTQGTFAIQTTSDLTDGAPTPAAPTVTGNSGWFFVGWSPLVSPTVTSDATYTAQWQQEVQPVVYVVAASAETGGTAAGGGTFLPGVFTTVDATASAGFTFDGWFENNALVSSDASYTFQVLGNRTLVAKFNPIPVATFYDVTASAGIGGSATGGGTFLAGSSATVIATTEAGYEFLGWFENGVLVSTTAVYTVVVNRDFVLDAVFELELVDEPEVPGAPELPETGATPFTFFYVFGAALGAAGISLGRKKSR